MSSSYTHKHSKSDKRDLQIRLKKIAGQVGAIQRMVDDDTDCSEVLTQVVSVRRAMKSFAEILIKQHSEGCIASATNPKDAQRLFRNLIQVINRYVE